MTGDDHAITLDVMSGEDACAEAIRREKELPDPEVRRQPEFVRALLHPDFIEFGASGRIWNIESIIGALASEQTPNEITATDFQATLLAPDVVLLNFKTETSERVCLRSSTWVKSDGEKWLLLTIAAVKRRSYAVIAKLLWSADVLFPEFHSLLSRKSPHLVFGKAHILFKFCDQPCWGRLI